MQRVSSLQRWTVALIMMSLLLALPTQASDSKARQILDHLYMSNGIPIRDLMVEMEVSGLPPDLTAGNLQMESREKVFFKQPNKLRDDSVLLSPGSPLNGTSRVYIRDGVNVWAYTSLSPTPLKQQDDPPTGSLRVPFFLQRYPLDADREYLMVGHQAVEGVPTEVIRVTTPTSPPDVITVWVDTQRWIPLKTEHVIEHKKPKPSTLRRVLYKDIRQTADGRWFPLQLEVYDDDVLTTMMVYKAISINTGLQDSLFDPMAKFIR